MQAVPFVMRLDGQTHTLVPELGPPHPGLFVHLVLYALRFVVPNGDRRFVEKRLAKLPDPRAWTEKSIREQAAMLGASDRAVTLGWRR